MTQEELSETLVRVATPLQIQFAESLLLCYEEMSDKEEAERIWEKGLELLKDMINYNTNHKLKLV